MSINPDTYAAFLSGGHATAQIAQRRRRERAGGALVLAGTVVVLGALLVIPLFLIASLLPWTPMPARGWEQLGVLLAGSLRAAACAILVAVPLGVATAIFNAMFCAPRLRAWIKPALEILEAIPTVVLGLIALATLAPWLKSSVATMLALMVIVPASLLGAGMAFGARVRRRQGWLPLWLAPAIVAIVGIAVVVASQRDDALIVPASPWNALLIGLALGLAAVPLVFSIAEDALMRIPLAHTQAALALGATRWQALTSIVLPAARSGLIAAIVLGASRCIGETMIVLLATGNAALLTPSLTEPVRTLSATIGAEMAEVVFGDLHYRVLFFIGALLFVISFTLNAVAEFFVRNRLMKKFKGI